MSPGCGSVLARPTRLQEGAAPESSLALTVNVTGTIWLFGDESVSGDACTHPITGAVVSALFSGVIVRRKARGAPLNVPSPTMTPALFRA